MDKLQLRQDILASYNIKGSECMELLEYNKNRFNVHSIQDIGNIIFPPEAHISTWEMYEKEAELAGVWGVLKLQLVQLLFPIQEGISNTSQYQEATKKGKIPADVEGLKLEEPHKLQLFIYDSIAGKVPVIITKNRVDFENLVRAITKKNEPEPIPNTMGACMIAGYNNWGRIRSYQERWMKDNPETNWKEEWKRIIPQKEMYQDKFIILSGGGYSNVKGEELGLTEEEWEDISIKIRLEHECTHYFTRRVFHWMGNNLLDEIIADYRGIVEATGHYRADWFLRFIGLENYPQYRQGGRLENYRGVPPLSEGAFMGLQTLVEAVARNIERFSQENTVEGFTMLMALCTLTIEELASKDALSILKMAILTKNQRGLKADSLRVVH